MFNCCFQYCKSFFNPCPINAGVYVEISNETTLDISFIVQYNVEVRTFTKKSPIFGPGKSERIQISHSAQNICFNVLDDSINPPGFICNVVLPKCTRHCYKLLQSGSSLHLQQFKC